MEIVTLLPLSRAEFGGTPDGFLDAAFQGWLLQDQPSATLAGRYRRLIMCARYPAPKPLSIFTTETPEAQLLSIPSSAASPPKAAP